MTDATPRTTSIDFIIPAHNEAETVGGVVDACRSALGELAVAGDIVVVADHCSDPTAEAASAQGAAVIERSGTYGSKAHAVQAGVRATSGDYVFLVDADCIGLTSKHLSDIAKPLLDRQVDMSVGVFDYRVVSGLVQRFPWSSGERILERGAFNWFDPRLNGYNLEVLINESVGASGGKTASTVMTGVRQRSKIAKHGRLPGIRADVEMWQQISGSVSEIDTEGYHTYMKNVRLYGQGEPIPQCAATVRLGFAALRIASLALRSFS